MDSEHPLGLIDNPEWEKARAMRRRLYLDHRGQRQAEREPFPDLAIMAGAIIVVCVAAVAYLIGALL